VTTAFVDASYLPAPILNERRRLARIRAVEPPPG